MARVVIAGVLAAAAMGASSSAGAAPSSASLYWQSAPPPGTHILLDNAHGTDLRIAAASPDRHARLTLQLLGKTPARLETRGRNPALGTVRFPSARVFGERTFVVTLVARLAGDRPLSITRTVIVSVRTSRISLDGPGTRAHWAYVLLRDAARRAPRPGARSEGVIETTTSDARPNLVRVLAEVRTPAGSVWVKTVLTSLPNSRVGWVRRNDLSLFHAVSTRLVVDTRSLKLLLFRAGRMVFRAAIGVGTSRWPTPRGSFYIRERLTNFRDPFYGPVAFGTSARSTSLTDWPGGGIVGIHGTNQPALIPGRISHGCIRLRNSDVLRLARLLPLGTPVEIR